MTAATLDSPERIAAVSRCALEAERRGLVRGTAAWDDFLRACAPRTIGDVSIFNPAVLDEIERDRVAAELAATDPFNRFAPRNQEAVDIAGVTVEGERLAPPTPQTQTRLATKLVALVVVVLAVLLGVELLKG